MSVVPPARTRRWAGTEDARCDRWSSLVVDVGLLGIVGVRSDRDALDLRRHLARLSRPPGTSEAAPNSLTSASVTVTGAHTVGFRGHRLTKSRRYSTTFAALRGARTAWTRPGTSRPVGIAKNHNVKD